MEEKIIVKLWNITSPMLVVPSKTNIIYQNQVGGCACLIGEMEGMLIPISNWYDSYIESLDCKLTYLFTDNSGIVDNEILQSIDEILQQDTLTQGVRVNYERADESHEAWVHVKVTETEFALYEGLNNTEAVLTWDNSD